jgi:hypothetical protein
MFRADFLPFTSKMGLAHFRWKTSTDLREPRGNAQKKPIHLPSLFLNTSVPPKVSKTLKNRRTFTPFTTHQM